MSIELQQRINIDVFNYYAICFLEKFGNFLPLQSEIDHVAVYLQELCEYKLKKLLDQLAKNENS